MDRLKELSKIIQDANIEVRQIQDEYKKEKNKNNIGHCFQDYVDDGDNHTDYYLITSVNIFGDMRCNKVSIWRTFGENKLERVLFSKDVFAEDYITKEFEISFESFDGIWNNCLIELASINN